MKKNELMSQRDSNDTPIFDLEQYIELGEKELQKGNRNKSLFWYKSGFEMAKQQKDRGRIQQFSNILCTLI
jgi:hypothetical protein